jgi:hypothetical protein
LLFWKSHFLSDLTFHANDKLKTLNFKNNFITVLIFEALTLKLLIIEI